MTALLLACHASDHLNWPEAFAISVGVIAFIAFFAMLFWLCLR